MPRPSLTDEIMELARAYADAEFDFGFHQGAWADGSVTKRARANVAAAKTALKSRLTALETELEGYRKAETGPLFVGTPPRQGWTGGTVDASDAYVMTLNTSLPCTSEYVNAQSDITGEDLG